MEDPFVVDYEKAIRAVPDPFFRWYLKRVYTKMPEDEREGFSDNAEALIEKYWFALKCVYGVLSILTVSLFFLGFWLFNLKPPQFQLKQADLTGGFQENINAQQEHHQHVIEYKKVDDEKKAKQLEQFKEQVSQSLVSLMVDRSTVNSVPPASWYKEQAAIIEQHSSEYCLDKYYSKVDGLSDDELSGMIDKLSVDVNDFELVAAVIKLLKDYNNTHFKKHLNSLDPDKKSYNRLLSLISNRSYVTKKLLCAVEKARVQGAIGKLQTCINRFALKYKYAYLTGRYSHLKNKIQILFFTSFKMGSLSDLEQHHSKRIEENEKIKRYGECVVEVVEAFMSEGKQRKASSPRKSFFDGSAPKLPEGNDNNKGPENRR